MGVENSEVRNLASKMESTDLCDSSPVSDFVNSVDSFLKEGQVEQTLSFFKDNKYESIVQNNSWDLIPIVTKYLTHEAEDTRPNEYQCCQKLINLISHKSLPEEALLQLIEEIEEGQDDVKFLNLLTPLKNVLQRIPHNKVNSLAWCLNAIQTFLRKLPIPNDLDLVEEEKLLMDCDSNFHRITSVYLELIPFYEYFVEQSCILKEFRIERQRVLCKFLIQLLDKPLSHLDLEESEKANSRGRRIAEKLIDCVLKLNYDPHIYLDAEEKENEFEFEKPSFLGLGVFYAIIFRSEKYMRMIPKLYNPVYIFQNILKFVSELFKQGNHCCTEKALGLIHISLNSVQGMKLSYLLLDSGEHCKFCKNLTSTVIYDQNEKTRKQALEVLKTYIHSFELRGQYLIIYNMMDFLNHSGLIGYIITIYKELLVSEMLTNEENMPSYFIGDTLWALLRKFCYLPNKEESDLLELSDQIISSLNLLRYLVLRDKKNVTNFKNYLPQLIHNYLDPLKKGIILSRGHYELKIKDIDEESKNKTKQTKESNVSVTVCGQNLPDISSEEKKKVLLSSLTAFDIMDSLLCRLNECIEILE